MWPNLSGQECNLSTPEQLPPVSTVVLSDPRTAPSMAALVTTDWSSLRYPVTLRWVAVAAPLFSVTSVSITRDKSHISVATVTPWSPHLAAVAGTAAGLTSLLLAVLAAPLTGIAPYQLFLPLPVVALLTLIILQAASPQHMQCSGPPIFFNFN